MQRPYSAWQKCAKTIGGCKLGGCIQGAPQHGELPFRAIPRAEVSLTGERGRIKGGRRKRLAIIFSPRTHQHVLVSRSQQGHQRRLRRMQTSQARRWCFTLNNPSGPNDAPCDWAEIKFATWQLEQGQGGTPHLQGYFECRSPRRLAWCRKLLPGAHFEPARGSQEANVSYCNKLEGRLDGPWSVGVAGHPSDAGQGARTDLRLVQEALDRGDDLGRVAEEHFGAWVRYRESFHAYRQLRVLSRDWPMCVIVLCGSPGTGKSRLARSLSPDAYWHPGGGEWFDGYEGQRVTVFDEFRGGVTWSLLCRLLDRYPLQVQVKGGFRQFVSHCVIITSNQRPEDWYDKEKFGPVLGALFRRITLFLWLEKREQECHFSVGYNTD